MPRYTINLSDELYEYMTAISRRESPLLQELREKTAVMPNAGMQIAPEQGQFLHLLIKLINAKRTLEIGVFTGYSSLCVASALPDDGEIIACDVNEEWTSLAQSYWQRANLAHKIKLHLAPAAQTLDNLIQSGQQNSFDFAFIVADKSNYDSYYERCLQLVRPGGLIIIDNVLWHGHVINPEQQDADTLAIRTLNQKLHHDQRVDLSLIPIGDGLTLLYKR